MPSLRATLILELDGKPFTTIVRRTEVPETAAFDYLRAGDGSVTPVSLPVSGILSAVEVLLLQTDRPISLLFNGGSDGFVDLGAGGVVFLWNVALDAAPTANVFVINSAASGNDAQVSGVAGGS